MQLLDPAHPTEQFYELIKQLVRLHMQHIKSHIEFKSSLPADAYRNEFKTIRVSSARQIGHTYTALKLLRELPGSILAVHSVHRARMLERQNKDLTGRISGLDFLYQELIKAPQTGQPARLIPLLIVDTAGLLEGRGNKAPKLENIIRQFDQTYDVKLFLYLE